MTVKITPRDILFANAVIGRAGGIEASGAARVKIARITRAIRTEAETINASLQELAHAHTVKGEDGKPKVIQTANGPDTQIADAKAFRAEQKALLDASIELAVEPIALADLGDKGGTDIIDALLPFTA
jgi:hypothetical protein